MQHIVLGVTMYLIYHKNMMKRIIYKLFGDNLILIILRNKVVEFVFPILVGIYYTALDIWGDSWAVIKDHQELHNDIFIALVICTLLFAFYRSISDWYNDKAEGRDKALLTELVYTTSNVVGNKLRKFQIKVRGIKQNSDIFKDAFRCLDQVRLLCDRAADYIRNNFKIDESKISITIIWVKGGDNIRFLHSTNLATKTKPEILLSQNSLAKKCLESNESIFVVNKKEAHGKGNYFLSKRDDDNNGEGFSLAHPVKISVSSKEYEFVISITTYCNSFSINSGVEEEFIKKILLNFCLRIEYELSLYAAYNWKHEGGRLK